MSTVYESASTSKWVTATIILSLVDRGFLSLDDRPQDFISWWPIGASDPLYNIRLRDLLSFTSGLVVEPGGLDSMDNPFGTMSNDVRAIALSNAGNGKTPATEFWYASTHLQVAGYMAVLARGAVDWQEVFKEFQARTGLFSTAQYDLPSVKNPRLAGGMHWSGNEYFRFIKAYYDKQILSPAMHDLAISDQLIGKSVPFFGSPIRMRLGQDWHYGFGLWLESTNASFNGQILAYSSPGAYGAYPFMNPQNRFYGMVARQGTNGTFPNGVAIYQAVMPLVIEWARTR